ncbi:hypothetical protein A9Q83_05550 [Alphaproteobacteria bacterium 46_93_T64]|nr:hypothetical protein A9Q83_05550 [Alphaproteobacteria bacterium 46_93_T64]
MKNLIYIGVTIAVVGTGLTHAQAGSLENLERERAILVQTMLSGNIDVQERQVKLETSGVRLVDLERMVLRDKSLSGKNTSMVQAAFQNYDLTFLVHASVEKGRFVTDHWLQSVGLSTQTLVNARMGRR